MEVQVDTYVEHLSGERKMVNTAHFVMVALDENDHPTPVPPLVLETDEEETNWKAGERRNELRRQRRLEQY